MNDKKKLHYIILVIIILILIAINIKVFISNYFKENEQANENKSQITNIVSTSEEDAKNRQNKISSLNERTRAQTYFGTYISYIESGQYENAYNLLYDGFKQTYFPTLQEFEKYAAEHYPANMIINYTDISREGTMYIITAEIRDVLSKKQDEAKSTRIVVMENGVNDYKISFEVET